MCGELVGAEEEVNEDPKNGLSKNGNVLSLTERYAEIVQEAVSEGKSNVYSIKKHIHEKKRKSKKC